MFIFHIYIIWIVFTQWLKERKHGRAALLPSQGSKVPGQMGGPRLTPLLLAQVSSWIGLAAVAYFQYQEAIILREVQDSLLELSWEEKAKRVSARGSGRPGNGGGGSEPDSPELYPFANSDKECVWSLGASSSATVASLLLLCGLVALLSALVVVRFFTRGREEEESGDRTPKSPIEHQRELAQRQLAELRLRNHGFGR